ncbi:uncharacterized protein LOC133516791 [Cydia pomonella]|uniref:uncharacterized protein LOC133516791 n=1 Tax=Cydia pomonella TaxID=82600 RepID=UPI002ADD44C4|nr:uncharacterized protein LOC133516791 [Cydia pomonella]
MDEDVRKLLITWNLEEYMEIFEKNKISVDCLNLLDDSMIRELFPTIGDRAIFQKNFQNWKSIALGQFSVMNMDVDILQEKHRNPLTEMTNIELFQTLMNTEDAPENANSDTPNPVSPLKVMENKQEGIQQSKDNKLLDLLQSSAEGKIILSLHKDDGLLSSSSRRRICNIIIKHLLGDDPSKTNIPSSVLFDMASQIKEVFNKENISTYFIPYINNKKLKIRRCAKGKLYDCLQNRKREYRIAARKMSHTSTPGSSTTETNEETEPEDVSDDVAWIKASTEPWKLLEQKWKTTTKHRLEETKNMTVTEYMAQYPGLKKPTGFHLLTIDFDTMYPGTSDNLYKYFMLSKQSIFQLASSKHKLVREKFQGVNAEEADNINALFTLTLLVAQPLHKKPKKRSWRPSKQESKDGFITHVTRYMNLNETIKQRREKYLQYGITFQPTIFIVGENLQHIEQYFVVVDNTFYTMHTIMQAVDVCFKAFQALNCKYPVESELIWLFIQRGFYKIRTSYDKEFVSVNSLLADLHLLE